MKWINFNPRTYVRCDSLLTIFFSFIIYFNPRTYVRCDPLTSPLLTAKKNFNPRTYVRCDALKHTFAVYTISFQSTHLREVRH